MSGVVPLDPRDRLEHTVPVIPRFSSSQSLPSYTNRRPGSDFASSHRSDSVQRRFIIALCIFRFHVRHPPPRHSCLVLPYWTYLVLDPMWHPRRWVVEGEDERGEDAGSGGHSVRVISAGMPSGAEVHLRGGHGPLLRFSHLLARAGCPPSTPPQTPHPP